MVEHVLWIIPGKTALFDQVPRTWANSSRLSVQMRSRMTVADSQESSLVIIAAFDILSHLSSIPLGCGQSAVVWQHLKSRSLIKFEKREDSNCSPRSVVTKHNCQHTEAWNPHGTDVLVQGRPELPNGVPVDIINTRAGFLNYYIRYHGKGEVESGELPLPYQRNH